MVIRTKANAADAIAVGTSFYGIRAMPLELGQPLFVCGTPRSGTTWLRKLLNASPDVCMTHEYHVLKRMSQACSWTDDIVEFIDVTRSERDALIAAASGVPLPVSAEEVLRVYGNLAEQDGKRSGCYWGDKHPLYLRSVGTLRRMWPNARVIIIQRDVEPLVASALSRAASDVMFRETHPAWSAGRWAGRWLEDVNVTDLVRTQEHTIRVRYEDLCVCGTAVLERVCAWLGVDAAPMLAVYAQSDQHKQPLHEVEPLPSEVRSEVNNISRSTLHAAPVVWLTGPPAVGKTTVARALAALYASLRRKLVVLDGDDLRDALGGVVGFDDASRRMHVRHVGNLAAQLARNGIPVAVSLVSPFRDDRAHARSLAPDGFLEVSVTAPMEVRRQRDPKGLYAKFDAGQLTGLTGVDAAYEEPAAPDIVLDTVECTPAEGAMAIFRNLVRNGNT